MRNHLEQIVKEEVANVEDDINLLWERLDSRYAKYSRYVEVVLEDLAKTTKGDAKATLRLINTVEKAKRDLDRIGAGQEMCNSFIIAQIEKKFPEEMRFEWIKEVASHAEEDTKYRFKLLMVFKQLMVNNRLFYRCLPRPCIHIDGMQSRGAGELRAKL